MVCIVNKYFLLLLLIIIPATALCGAVVDGGNGDLKIDSEKAGRIKDNSDEITSIKQSIAYMNNNTLAALRELILANKLAASANKKDVAANKDALKKKANLADIKKAPLYYTSEETGGGDLGGTWPQRVYTFDSGIPVKKGHRYIATASIPIIASSETGRTFTLSGYGSASATYMPPTANPWMTERLTDSIEFVASEDAASVDIYLMCVNQVASSSWTRGTGTYWLTIQEIKK